MKSHLLALCLACSTLVGCATTTTVAPLFPTSNTTVAQRGEPAQAELAQSPESAPLPSRGAVVNGMACRSE